MKKIKRDTKKNNYKRLNEKIHKKKREEEKKKIQRKHNRIL